MVRAKPKKIRQRNRKPMKLFPVYMTDEEKRTIAAAATRARESISGFMVKSALGRAAREPS